MATVEYGKEYIIEKGDWLSKLLLGNPGLIETTKLALERTHPNENFDDVKKVAYIAALIVARVNNHANANAIEVGQTFTIPSQQEFIDGAAHWKGAKNWFKNGSLDSSYAPKSPADLEKERMERERAENQRKLDEEEKARAQKEFEAKQKATEERLKAEAAERETRTLHGLDPQKDVDDAIEIRKSRKPKEVKVKTDGFGNPVTDENAAPEKKSNRPTQEQYDQIQNNNALIQSVYDKVRDALEAGSQKKHKFTKQTIEYATELLVAANNGLNGRQELIGKDSLLLPSEEQIKLGVALLQETVASKESERKSFLGSREEITQSESETALGELRSPTTGKTLSQVMADAKGNAR